jgi:hypothetical protein
MTWNLRFNKPRLKRRRTKERSAISLKLSQSRSTPLRWPRVDSRLKPKVDNLPPEEEVDSVIEVDKEVVVKVEAEVAEEEVEAEVVVMANKDQELPDHQSLMPRETQSKKESTRNSKESQDKKTLILSIEDPELEEAEDQLTRKTVTENSTLVIKSTSLTRRREKNQNKKKKKRLRKLRSKPQSQSQKWKSLDSLLMNSWLEPTNSKRKKLERLKV